MDDFLMVSFAFICGIALGCMFVPFFFENEKYR